tara:strand:+ start:146 stop:343 length:198 start_codon:yes stop_codon:yes gene_type:complete
VAVIHLAGLIALFLFGAMFVILGLFSAILLWNTNSPEQLENVLLVVVLGFALIGAGLYVAKRSKN